MQQTFSKYTASLETRQQHLTKSSVSAFSTSDEVAEPAAEMRPGHMWLRFDAHLTRETFVKMMMTLTSQQRPDFFPGD